MDINVKAVLLERIDSALDKVRPHLHVDGGGVRLLDISEEFVVQVEWMGKCQHCDMSAMTLKAGIEQAVIDHVPEVKSVEPIN